MPSRICRGAFTIHLFLIGLVMVLAEFFGGKVRRASVPC